VHVYYSDTFTFPLPDGHRFPLVKYRLLRERILQQPATCGAELRLAPRATRDDLLLVHDEGYVDAFCAGQLSKEHNQRIGFPWSQELVERTLRSAGGTIAAVRAVLRGESPDAAAYLAGGTHHARRDRGAGYCVFNDVAVGARIAQREFSIGRVLVVDTDVHQGDGTASIFEGDDSVFTFSIHGAQNFPSEKATSDLDIALPDGTTDEAFLRELARGLDTSFSRARPEFVLYLSGADALVGDRLGRLRVSKAGLQERDRMVLAACGQAGVEVVTVMGGGYGGVIAETVEVYEASVLATLGYSRG
jgi:acetoin utilization deacetylase AcuC-like enzyme